jgi:hypothetical protein
MTLPAATRRLTVTYGSTGSPFRLDDSNGIILQAHGRGYTLRETWQDGFFSVDLVVRLLSPSNVEATDDLAFQGLCNNVEAALSLRRQTLRVMLNGNVINGNGQGWAPTIDSSSNQSAFLIEAELEKTGHPTDTGRRRTYRFNVRCQLPAEVTYDYRRDSACEVETAVNGNRTANIHSTWTADGDVNAVTNAIDNSPTFETGELPDNLPNGQWVLATSKPIFDDENAICTVNSTYFEVIFGLREYRVDVHTDANQALIVSIAGFYMETPDSQTSLQNYTNNIGTLVTQVLTAAGGQALFESKSTPKEVGYDTTGKLYRFVHTYKQIVYNQGPSFDDPNITFYTLHVETFDNWNRQSISTENPVTRLRRARAIYTAIIDIGSSEGLDPYTLWTSKFQAYVLNAVQTKLGALSVTMENADVDVGLDGNTLTVHMDLLVRGGSILELTMAEGISRSPALDAWPMGDGTANSFWPYWVPTFRKLLRYAEVEYIPGLPKPEVWGSGPQASGYAFIDTGMTMEAALDLLEQNQVPPAPGWVPTGFGLEENFSPTSRGNDNSLATVLYTRKENWLYVLNWAQQQTVPTVT